MTYRIKLGDFEGPLDALLRMIEEQKMDISQISLAQVAEQFLEHVRNLPQDADPRLLADYLVVACKLLVIKSRSLLPHLEIAQEEEQDAIDLAAQLILLRKFKVAARYLKRLDNRRRQGFERAVGWEERMTFYPDPDITISTLYAALQAIAKSVEELVQLPQEVVKEVISISEKIEQLLRIIQANMETKLAELLTDAKSKTEIIVTFLAMLELVKQKALTVEQHSLFGDITLRKSTAD